MSHKRSLDEGITLQIGKGIWPYLLPYARVHEPTYAGVDHRYVALTMHTYATGQKTLAASFKYKIVVWGLQTFTKRVLSLKTPPGLPNGIIHSSIDFGRIKKLDPSFKDALIPLSLSCIFPYHQIKVNEPFLRAAAKFWIPTRHVFQFNGMELCLTLEEFSAIVGKSNIHSLILPTTYKDFSIMA